MDAAEKMVLERGFAGTALDDILGALGVTKGAFFHHFRSKADLGFALAERFAERDIAHLKKNLARAERLSSDPLQQILILIGLFEEDIEAIGDMIPSCLFASYLHERELFDARTIDIIRDAFRNWRATLEARFAAMLEAYPPRTQVQPADLVDMLLSTFEGGMILGRAHNDPELMRRQLRLYRSYLEMLCKPVVRISAGSRASAG
jgi:TetR/AcrR family transcriptional repressor of nem operon